MTYQPDDILRAAAEAGVEFVSLQFTDIVGGMKHVTIPVGELPDCLDHGVWFDGSAIEAFARIAENDMYLVPDPTTFALIPWDEGTGYSTARLICDVYSPDGWPFVGDPRFALRRAIDDAARMGFGYRVSPEVEFFLLRMGADGRPALVPHDRAGYFDATTDAATRIRRRMIRALAAFGIAVETSHHEVALGQHEIDLRVGPALELADAIMTLRTVVKTIAHQLDLYATFMPKPIAGLNGNGMHVHQSLVALDGRSAFHQPDDPYQLSPIARHFTAGLLAHARGMSAILAPLVNSYKRLVPGYEAPIYLTWGRTNRAALVRVPRISPGRPHTTRVELRCPDPTTNPYLAFAVMLAAGLDGIRRSLPLPPATEEDLFQVDPRSHQVAALPPDLGTALDELQRDQVICDALGPYILERLLEARTREWQDYGAAVSQWELERYLAVY